MPRRPRTQNPSASQGRRRSTQRRHRRPFYVVHEDRDLIVVDKEAGLLTVPIPGSRARNLKEILEAYLRPRGGHALQVHRIDRYTSGLVVFARHPQARERLIEQFRAHTPERLYLALVRGVVEADAGTLRHQLRLTQDGFRQEVVPRGGTEAVTHYRVQERLPGATLVEARLETGLKNQIRVQFQAAGHPLIGDRHYEAAEATQSGLQRQALHAWKLAVTHPGNGRRLSCEAQLAGDLRRLLGVLRGQGISASVTPPLQD